MSCPNDLKERGGADILIVCIDGLTGFPEAIRVAYPQTKVQLGIGHLVQAAFRDTTETDGRELKWGEIVPLFEFPSAIREAIDTTDAIESINSVIRKFPRNRKQYPNDEWALKLMDPTILEASKKGAMSMVGWPAALNHFATGFEGRIPTNAMN